MSRRGRGRGQGNRGRKGGRARGSVGGGSKGKGKSKGGASSGRRGGQGNRGRTSTSRNAASNKGKRGGYGKGGASTGRRGGQGNKGTPTGRAKGTVSRQSVAKGLSRVGNITRQLRQPVTGLSRLAISSLINNPAVARSIAQYGVNTFGEQNRRTRDMSKLTPQQRRRFESLSEKTGRDYSIRKPTFRLNMNMRDIARFAGLDKSGLYNRLPSSIRNAQVNKQFYGNPTKRGWHSSQRTGRGQGLRTADFRDSNRDGIDDRDQYTTGQPRQIPPLRHADFGREIRGIPREPMGPQQDWLGDLYRTHNINQGSLDQGARDYWTNEAKTKGRDAVMQSIIGTSKAQGTYGGPKKPRRISTGSRRRGGGGIWGPIGIGLLGSVTRSKRANRHHRQQAAAAQRSYDLQAKGMKRRQGMLAKTIAATMAARGM